MTEKEKKIVEENHKNKKHKTEMFLNVIKSVPNGTFWGLQELYPEIWDIWYKLKPFIVESHWKYEWYDPDVYFEINDKSREVFQSVLLDNPLTIGYFWHNIFFKDEIIYAEIIEGDEQMSINKDLNIDISGHEDWVDYL
ncbi:MAG: hypothetical protein LBR52_01965 [Prevotellaceae bacterium]|jgi:hypothetical protein|nr:hypothetical protein [Prevotellaceae bacterium]